MAAAVGGLAGLTTLVGEAVDEPPLLYGEWGLVTFNSPSANAKINYSACFGVGLMIIIDDD